MKNSTKESHKSDDVTLMWAELARAIRQRHDENYVNLFIRKVVLTLSNHERQIYNKLFDLRKWDMELVDFCMFEHFRWGHFK